MNSENRSARERLAARAAPRALVKRWLGRALLTLSCGVVLSCGDPGGWDAETGSFQDGVQADWENIGNGYWSVALEDDAAEPRRLMTGVVLGEVKLQVLDHNPKWITITGRATCGMTFVSPTYGVTAAHCVDSFDIGEQFTVQQLDTRQLSRNAVNAQASVVGSGLSGYWPAWEHATTMTANAGYRVTERACTVARRCSTADGGRYQCPFSEESDIALIHCPDRLRLQPFADTMSSNPSLGSDIEVDWYHEVVDLPMYDDGSEYWDHYGGRDDSNPYFRSWHYRPQGHQVLPLISRTFADGTPYSLTVTSPNSLQYDTPICHGTSGSGVFLAGTTTVLGAALSSGTLSGRLCHPMDQTTPGTANFSSTRPVHAHKLATTKEARSDIGTFVALAL